MSLYQKVLQFKPEDVDKMTFDACSELLLYFRYLLFRDDHSLTQEFIKRSMKQIQARLQELNPEADKNQNFI